MMWYLLKKLDFETGLFGLGFGNTLSMIFGAIIIVGLVAYFIVRRN